MTSCEDYLDKSPESTVSEEDAFKNFRNFQGFIEEIYNCIPDKEKCNYCTSWNWGDDELFNSMGDGHMTHQADLGNFRAWQSNGQCWLYRDLVILLLPMRLTILCGHTLGIAFVKLM